MNTAPSPEQASRSLAFNLSCLLFSCFSYALCVLSLLYLMGFLSRTLVPKHIDSGEQGPWLSALAIDLVLITLFALQHSVMARQGYKRKQRAFVPAQIERATYVLFSSLALILLLALWQPIADPVWQVESPLARTALIALYWLGWLIVLLATFLLSRFELFGIKQAIDGFRPRSAPVETFRTPFFYKLVRHPLYLGFLILFWATPEMSVGHLLFALACSTYIVIGTRLEERDLLQVFGTTYQHYQQRVGMLLPRLGRHRGSK